MYTVYSTVYMKNIKLTEKEIEIIKGSLMETQRLIKIRENMDNQYEGFDEISKKIMANENENTCLYIEYTLSKLNKK